MKHVMIIAAALTAFAGVASAQPVTTLTSSSQVILQTLAPDLDVSDLSAVQVRRINQEVSSNSGLTQPVLGSILGR